MTPIPSVLGWRVGFTPLPFQEPREVVLRQLKIGLKTERFLDCCNGRFPQSETRVSETDVVIGLCVIRFERQRTPSGINRLAVALLIAQAERQVEQTRGSRRDEPLEVTRQHRTCS